MATNTFHVQNFGCRATLRRLLSPAIMRSTDVNPRRRAILEISAIIAVMATTFLVLKFGCRATQADGAAIERALMQRGWERREASNGAALVVLNTSTVTASADADARAAIRRLHRENPGCKILVTGCYAQRAPQELAGMQGVSWVVGNSHKHAVADVIASAAPAAKFFPLEKLTATRADFAPQMVGDI